jgi:hypothetical protein
LQHSTVTHLPAKIGHHKLELELELKLELTFFNGCYLLYSDVNSNSAIFGRIFKMNGILYFVYNYNYNSDITSLEVGRL